jgi:hypothetical protein
VPHTNSSSTSRTVYAMSVFIFIPEVNRTAAITCVT